MVKFYLVPQIRSQIGNIFLPVRTIEGNDLEQRTNVTIQTIHIHIVIVGMRTGTIKRVDAANRTKGVHL